MSYIRCLSNPEGLYIYGGADGVWINHNVRPPLASKKADDGCSPHFIVPQRDFDQVGLKWDKGWAHDERVRSGKLVAQEVHVYLDTGRPVERDWHKRIFRETNKVTERRPSAFFIKLSYGRRFVMLWRVTWQYVVRSIVEHNKWEKEDAKRKEAARAGRVQKARLRAGRR